MIFSNKCQTIHVSTLCSVDLITCAWLSEVFTLSNSILVKIKTYKKYILFTKKKISKLSFCPRTMSFGIKIY